DFARPSEPPSWQGAVALAGSALLAWLCRRNMPAVAGAIAAAVIALGFVAAQLRTQMVAAPVLARDIGPVAVRGRVVEIEPMPHGRRLLLDQVEIPGVASGATPQRVRIQSSVDHTALRPGDRIEIRTALGPPRPPDTPGAFDFQRQAFFEQIGGTGFTTSDAALVDTTSSPAEN